MSLDAVLRLPHGVFAHRPPKPKASELHEGEEVGGCGRGEARAPARGTVRLKQVREERAFIGQVARLAAWELAVVSQSSQNICPHAAN